MPGSWNQFQQSGFPLDDYAKEMPIGEYEVIVDGVCYAKMASRFGTGIHLFARIRETDKKHWFFVHYVPGHASYLRAKELTAGDHVRLMVEAGRNGRGLIKDVVPLLGQNKTADSCRPEPGVGAGRGRSEWAGEAKRVGKVALVCSRPEAGRGKDSPPRRLQTSAIKARVRQGVQGNSLS